MNDTEIKVWTIQMSRWRVAKALDIPLLDITAKSGKSAFAPDFDLVMAYKRGDVPNGLYTDLYDDKMGVSIANQPEVWERLKTALIANPKIAVACYCPEGAFCHRHLFVDILEKYLAESGLKIERMGELIKKEGNDGIS